MALSMYESFLATRACGGRPGHARRILQRPGGLGALGGSRSRAIYAAALAAEQKKKLEERIAAVVPRLAVLANQANSLKVSLQAQVSQAEQSLRASGDPGGFALLQQLSDVGFEVDAAVQEVLSVHRDVQAKVRSGSATEADVNGALQAMQTGLTRAQRAVSGAAAVISRIQQSAQAAQQAAGQAAAAQALAAQQAAAQAQSVRDEAAAARAADQQAQQLRWDREQQIRADERSYEQQILAQQQAQQDAARASAEASRSGEMEFQRMLLEMEQRRQERQEEVQGRQAEQAQLMQRLLFMQELGLQPTAAMLFPGMAPPTPAPQPQPGYPQYQQQGWQQQGWQPAPSGYGVPGFASGPFGPVPVPYGAPSYGAPGVYPPGVIQGYGGPSMLPPGGVPGMPIQGQNIPIALGPGLMPYAQSGPMPYGAPAMMMTAFSPAAELFGLGQGGQGTWLSPGQVNPRELMSARTMISRAQRFGGLGQAGQGTWMSPGQVNPRELLSAQKMIAHHQRFNGLGQAGQGTWMSPSQVNPRELMSAQQMIASKQGFFRSPFELSGLGTADQPVSNTRLRGAQIEAGYQVFGPSLNAKGQEFYTYESPDGRTWTEWGNKVIGPASSPVLDPATNRIVYAPPPGGEAEIDIASITKTVRELVGTGLDTYQQVVLTRELEKQAREARRAGQPIPTSLYPPQPPPAQGVPGWALGIGALAVGAGIAGAIASKKKRKKKRKK